MVSSSEMRRKLISVLFSLSLFFALNLQKFCVCEYNRQISVY